MRRGLLYFLVFFTLIVSSLFSGCAPGTRVTEKEVAREEDILKKKSKAFRFEQNKRLIEMGLNLLAQIPEPMEVRFLIGDCDEVNAAAQPGIVGICRGMLRFVKSDDELASVVGHELAHLSRGHHGKVGLLDVSSIILGIMVESSVPGSGLPVADLIRRSMSAFDREQERDADYYGLIYMYKAGFDPEAGVSLWERFAVELPERRGKSLFDTHPVSSERTLRARRVATQLKQDLLKEEVDKTAHGDSAPVIYGLHAMPVPELLADPDKRPRQWQIFGIIKAGEKELQGATLEVTFGEGHLSVAQRTINLSLSLSPYYATAFSFEEDGIPSAVNSVDIALKEVQ